jgi:hypothetical protein
MLNLIVSKEGLHRGEAKSKRISKHLQMDKVCVCVCVCVEEKRKSQPSLTLEGAHVFGMQRTWHSGETSGEEAETACGGRGSSVRSLGLTHRQQEAIKGF